MRDFKRDSEGPFPSTGAREDGGDPPTLGWAVDGGKGKGDCSRWESGVVVLMKNDDYLFLKPFSGTHAFTKNLPNSVKCILL